MATKAECANCGTWFVQNPGPGRPRLYCTDECRIHRLRTVFQPAWYQREKLKKLSHNKWLI